MHLTRCSDSVEAEADHGECRVSAECPLAKWHLQAEPHFPPPGEGAAVSLALHSPAGDSSTVMPQAARLLHAWLPPEAVKPHSRSSYIISVVYDCHYPEVKARALLSLPVYILLSNTQSGLKTAGSPPAVLVARLRQLPSTCLQRARLICWGFLFDGFPG